MKINYHITNKYGIYVNDFQKAADLLNAVTKSKFQLKISSLLESKEEDELHIGYVKIKSLI